MYELSLRERKLNHKHIIQLPLKEWKLKGKNMDYDINANIFMENICPLPTPVKILYSILIVFIYIFCVSTVFLIKQIRLYLKK